MQCTKAVRRLLEMGWLRVNERAFGCKAPENLSCASHKYPENNIAHLYTYMESMVALIEHAHDNPFQREMSE